MAETHFDHGDLPKEAAKLLRCPNPHLPHREPDVEAVDGSGYRAKFRCTGCGLEFTISDAHLRRKVVGR